MRSPAAAEDPEKLEKLRAILGEAISRVSGDGDVRIPGRPGEQARKALKALRAELLRVDISLGRVAPPTCERELLPPPADMPISAELLGPPYEERRKEWTNGSRYGRVRERGVRRADGESDQGKVGRSRRPSVDSYFNH